jgi:cell wall-associated NlpC family hydrolase
MDEISYDYEYEETYEEMTPAEETTSNAANSDIIAYGSQFVGNPYSWGGNSLTDGIDCSHFVWQVLSNTGHYDGEYAVSDGWASLGSEVGSLDEAVAGDVIVYPGHVALYDG